MKNNRYVHVIETCAGCGDKIYIKTQDYTKTSDGRFFHIRHYKKNIPPIKPPKSNGHVPPGLIGVTKIGKGM